jgi:hypothetical protein
VLGKIAASLVRILDGEVTRRNKTDETFFDYKSDLKSPKAVEALRARIISQYQIVVDNGYAPGFSDAWKGSASSAKKKNGATS